QVPDHPLVHQALEDCLHDLMDATGLERLLKDMADGQVEVLTRELSAPSPLAEEIISARSYAFLDDAPAEERRTRAIRTRHLLDPEEAATIGRLEPDAIRQVLQEAWPEARTPDELHDALTLSGFLAVPELPPADSLQWPALLAPLLADRRATVVAVAGGQPLWVAAERLAQLQLVRPDLAADPPIDAAHAGQRSEALDREQALRELLRSRLETLGPVTASVLAAPLGVPVADAEIALIALEGTGQAMRGRYTGSASTEEWCDRRLLARIHRYTLKTLRRSVEPVSPAACMRFLFRWHQLGTGSTRAPVAGPDALRTALSRLAGYPLPAAAWEVSLLPGRVPAFEPAALDQLLLGGEFLWLRPGLEAAGPVPSRASRSGPIRTTPILFLERSQLALWQSLLPPPATSAVSPAAQQVETALGQHGALFFADLVRLTGLERNTVEAGLRELVGAGRVNGDGFGGLRTLLLPAARRRAAATAGWRARRPGPPVAGTDPPGRWSLVLAAAGPAANDGSGDSKLRRAVVELVAKALLDRYGVVFRALLQREARWLPPWRQLAHAWRRLEARGEIRGGRFVAGFGGEQFAWPEAVETLREVRHAGNQDHEVILSAADPLNLTGIVTPGEKVPALFRNRVLYRNGVPVAAWLRGDFVWLAPPDAQAEWAARTTLARANRPSSYVEGPGLAGSSYWVI
ncbi:MAG: ATP-dependent DNA helicase, partial [Gammaproteobacteria bacterium]